MTKLLTRFRFIVRRTILLQILLLVAFWVAGDAVARGIGLPIPGGVIGMAMLLVLLARGWVRPASVRLGAYWLLAEMLLFFVPAVMAVIEHGEFVGLLGLKIGAVILTGTMLVMAGTALTVDLLYRWRGRHAVG